MIGIPRLMSVRESNYATDPIMIIAINFENVTSLHPKLGLEICPKLSRFSVYSGLKPCISKSRFTQSPHVLLVQLLPLHFTPTTSKFLKPDIQSSTILHSRCLHRLNLHHLTTSAMHQSCKEFPIDCTNQCCIFHPSTKRHSSISPSYVLFSPNLDSQHSVQWNIQRNVIGPFAQKGISEVEWNQLWGKCQTLA